MSRNDPRSAVFKDYATMLPQGARSRYEKAMEALEQAEDCLPGDALDGTKSDLVKGIRALEVATANLNELLAYRKMLGVD